MTSDLMYKPCKFLGKDNLDQGVLGLRLKITKEINYDLWVKSKESLLKIVKTKEEA